MGNKNKYLVGGGLLRRHVGGHIARSRAKVDDEHLLTGLSSRAPPTNTGKKPRCRRRSVRRERYRPLPEPRRPWTSGCGQWAISSKQRRYDAGGRL